MSNTEFKSCKTIEGFDTFTKGEWKRDKGLPIRVAGDEWTWKDKCELLSWFLKGLTLKALRAQFASRKIAGIVRQLDKMCQQYGTVPIACRSKEYWRARLIDDKNPRATFAVNTHWINNFTFVASEINANQEWWIKTRLKYRTDRGEYNGTSWKRIAEETGMNVKVAELKYKHLCPAIKGLFDANS